MAKSISINLEFGKFTKNTVLFVEKTESEFVPVLLGNLYVPKTTLAGIGYNGGNIIAEISTDTKTGIVLTPEKPTKNTVLFAEKVESEFAPVQIDRVYIPKTTLAGIGWKPDTNISLRISIAK